MTDAIRLSPLSAILAFIVIWPLIGFAVSRALRRNDIADLLWGTGIACVAWLVAAPNFELLGHSQRLLLTLVSLWAIRLTLHLAIRNLPREEDPRYVDMRKRWGSHEPRNAYLKVFLLQSVLAVIVGTAAWWKLREPFLFGDRLTRGDMIGFFLAVFGLVLEAIADQRLLAHMNHPENRGKPLRSGPWAWSRHPNYFGETAFWWGIALLGLRRPEDFGAFAGAMVISWLLLRVSGVPLLDVKMKERNAAYRAYFREVSPFVPMPPGFWKLLKKADKEE